MRHKQKRAKPEYIARILEATIPEGTQKSNEQLYNAVHCANGNINGPTELPEAVKYVPFSIRAEGDFTETPDDPGWELLRYELIGWLPSGLSFDNSTAFVNLLDDIMVG